MIATEGALHSADLGNDLHALRTLYSDHHGWLQSWLRRKLDNAFDAADLAQDTFLRLLLKNAALRDITTPRIYIAHIAKGLLIDYWRKQSLKRDYLHALTVCGDANLPSQELQAMIIETLLEIDAMLDKLPVKVRQAFLLAQIDGLTYQEIGKIIGVSERMVKKYMATAMMHCMLLKRQLQA